MVIGHEESLFKKGYCLGHPSDTYGTEISLEHSFLRQDNEILIYNYSL